MSSVERTHIMVNFYGRVGYFDKTEGFIGFEYRDLRAIILS